MGEAVGERPDAVVLAWVLALARGWRWEDAADRVGASVEEGEGRGDEG